jgi:peptide/nickel transport system substrate-binding protein
MEEQIQELQAAYGDGRIDRREFLKWSAVLGLAAPFVDLAAARAAGPVRRGGTMKLATAAPTTIEPPALIDAPGIAVVQLVGEYLVTVDDKLHLHPQLATSWKPSENFKTWTVHVRQGVKFHNGHMMTADDVVATFKRLVNPRGSSSALSSLTFLKMEGVRKVDQFTVAFHLERPVADFPYYLNTYQAVILPANWPGHFGKNPIGTGPFKLVEYVPKQRARYVKNPDYWQKGLPYLDGAEITLGLSTDGQVTALLGGSADVLVSTPATALPALRGNSNVKVLTARSSYHNGIFMRTDKAPFTDKRVRQAMALCLNRPDIVKTVEQGLGVIGDDNVIAPAFPLYSPIAQRVQDYARARALLRAAGHPNGFSITLTTASDTAGLLPLATVAQAMWKPAGIKVKIKSEPGSVYYVNDWLQAPLTVTEWTHRPTPSQFLDTAYRTGAQWNASHWSNATFDRLTRDLDATLDSSKRKAIARQIELLMKDAVPAIIPVFNDAPRAMRSNVQGVVADPSNFVDLSRAYFSS